MAVLIKNCVFTDNQDGASSPTSPHQDNGVMAQPKKIKGIGFGDIFREGSVKLRVSQRLPSDNEEKKEKVSVVLHMTLSSFPSSKETFCDDCSRLYRIDRQFFLFRKYVFLFLNSIIWGGCF